MTEKELEAFKAAAAKSAERIQTREQAREALRRQGLIDEAGELTEPYRS